MFSPLFISDNTLDDILEKMRLKNIYDSYNEDNKPQLIQAMEDKFKSEKNHQDFQQNIINILDNLNPQNHNDKEILETLQHFFMALQSGDSVPLNMGSSCPFGDDCRFIQRYLPNSLQTPTQSRDEKHLEKYHKNHWTLPINEKIYKLLNPEPAAAEPEPITAVSQGCIHGDRCYRMNKPHIDKYHPKNSGRPMRTAKGRMGQRNQRFHPWKNGGKSHKKKTRKRKRKNKTRKRKPKTKH